MSGPKKPPELGKGIGDGIRGFKTAMKKPEDSSDQSTTTRTRGRKPFDPSGSVPRLYSNKASLSAHGRNDDSRYRDPELR